MKKIKLKKLPIYQLRYILLFVSLVPLMRFFYDNDFWFTINQGRYILQYGFPFKVINVIHDLDFIYQSWGTGVVFYLIYNYFGKYGIVSLLIVVDILFIFFYYKLCYVVSNNKRVSYIVTIFVTLIYNLLYLTTRPHIFTSLNLTIILYLLESFIKTNNKKYLYFLPLIFFLQVNMHGIYFILLLIIIFPYIINSFKFKINDINSDGYLKKNLFIVYIVCLLVGFLNPYGYKTIIYGFLSYGKNGILNNFINELLAPNFHQFGGKMVTLFIIVIYFIYAKKKHIQVRHYLLLIGTSYLAFDSLKSFNLFLICSSFPLTYMYNNFKDTEPNFSKTYHIIHFCFTCVICLVMILNIPDSNNLNIEKFLKYLDDEVENKENIKLYTNFLDGSYAEYRGYYCYIDPRAEVFLKSNNHKFDILKEFYNLQNLQINYYDFLDKYKFDYLLVDKKSDTLYYLMTTFGERNYKVILEDENHCLYKLVGE